MFLNLLGNIVASWEANFVSATMFPEVDKQGNIDRKHNVVAKMFPSFSRTLHVYCPLALGGRTFVMFIDINVRVNV